MTVLPMQFADLEAFAEWAVPTERARYERRVSSSMEELQAFYDAAFARMADVRSYLQAVPYGADMSEEDKRLTWLYCALCTVSFPVEVWRQPRVPDSGPASMDAVVEPAI